jgi:hypothetical protein
MSIEALKAYFCWGDLRLFVLRVIFICIAGCASVLGFQTFSQFKLLIGTIIFCCMIIFDLVLAPHLPNWVHYTNRLLAIAFSISLMVFVGLTGSMQLVADKEDSTYSTLLERIESKEKQIAAAETKTKDPAFIMNSDKEMVRDNESLLETLNFEKDELLKEKQQYNEDSGGKYQDGTVRIYKVIADYLSTKADEDITPDTAALIVLLIAWVSITSIQTVLSAEVHGIKVYRPSLMRALGIILLYIFDIKARYIDKTVPHGPKRTKKRTKKSTVAIKKDGNEVSTVTITPPNRKGTKNDKHSRAIKELIKNRVLDEADLNYTNIVAACGGSRSTAKTVLNELNGKEVIQMPNKRWRYK